MPLYKYNCTLGLINKLDPKTLLYMQPLHKIFAIFQSHECRLPLWRLLHFNPWVSSLILYIIQFHKYIYFSNSLLKWLDPILWITKLIKLISREYFISPLGDYEFHLENICSINIKCGCPIYWGFGRDL